MKVNEFVNNNNLKEEFEKLDRMVFLETAHLSDLEMISNNKHYKIILEKINDLLPFVIEKILNKEGTFAHRLLFLNVTKVEKCDSSFSDLVYNWWVENKHKYGK